MVSFNCESCNDVVKKPKLDAHKGRCRNAVFSCIDCSTTFQGTDYRSHTSCISEDQKYQGALFRGDKVKGKKGAKPAPAPAPAVVEDVVMEEPTPAAKEEEKPSKKAKKEKKEKKSKKEEPAAAVEEPVAEEAPKAKKDKKSKKAEEKPAAAVEEKEEVKPAAAVEEAPKGKKEKKDKKRKLDTAEADTTEKKPKKSARAFSSASAEALLGHLKAGRPLTLAKALARLQKGLGDAYNTEELFNTLRIKREKDGSVALEVVGAKEARE